MALEPMKEERPGPDPSGGADPASGPGAAIGLPSIPGYRIEETLGRGSTGVVFRATQLAVDRQVALKVLHPEVSGRPRAVRRLQREARTAARLAHPNIVTAIDMGESRGLWWYAMELVAGESLAVRLKSVGRLSQREALRLFTPLVDALDHAFRQGVVHRDIKPANVLIDTDGRPRLVDLGLAFREDDPLITNPGGTLGTPHYVSPEQARNPLAADTRSDIWSLGATLYHAVCGRPPFEGSNVADILSSVLYGRVVDPLELEPRLTRGFALVLRKCLARDPAGRYQTPHELLEDLERLREKRAVSVRAKGLDPVRRERGLRWRWPWLAATGGMLALATWVLWSLRAAPPGAEGAQSGSGQAAWIELEELARKALVSDERPIARALLSLADLAPAPTRYLARYEEIEEKLLERWREAQDGFVLNLASEVERLVNARNFVAAEELLGPGLDARIRSELDPAPSQLEPLLRRLEQRNLAEQVRGELEAYLASLKATVEQHFRGAVFARVENDVRAGEWRGARAELEREPLERLREANIALGGVPEDRVAELESALRAELAQRIAALEDQWRALDASLVGLLEEQHRRLAVALQSRRQPASAEEELRQVYARRVAELHLTDPERLDFVSDAAPRALARLTEELRQLEHGLLEQDAQAWLENERAQDGLLVRERRYGELAARWERGLGQDWLAPVRAEIEIELAAARLLEGLLARAGQGVAALHGTQTSILVGSIERRGRLEAEADPLQSGFRLVPAVGTPVVLALRPLSAPPAGAPGRATPLGAEALERFAGLPADPAATADPSDRLARALLRHHEGDNPGAARCLPIAAFGDPVLDALCARLAEAVGRVELEHLAEREELEAEAEELLNLTLRTASHARSRGDAQAAARSLDELIERFRDTETFRRRDAELKDLRAALLAPRGPTTEEDLRQAFGPTALDLAGGRAQLRFDFGSDFSGAWSRGDWRADAQAWYAPGVRSREQLLDDTGWPRLVLGPPIDLDAQLVAAFTFEQPQASGPPQLLVASVAGVHIALRGAQGAEPPRVLIGSGGPEEFLRLVEDIEVHGKGQTFAGLKRGERYTLTVELVQRRGKATVRLSGADSLGGDFGGRELVRQENPRLEGSAGTASLVLRSFEPVRLLEASVDARVQ